MDDGNKSESRFVLMAKGMNDIKVFRFRHDLILCHNEILRGRVP